MSLFTCLLAIIILFNTLIVNPEKIIHRDKSKTASNAISAIIDHFIRETSYSVTFEIIVIKESQNFDIFMDIVNRVVKKTNNSVRIEVKNMEKPHLVLYPERHMILMCDKDLPYGLTPYSKHLTRKQGFLLKYSGYEANAKPYIGHSEEFHLVHHTKSKNIILLGSVLIKNQCRFDVKNVNVFSSKLKKWRSNEFGQKFKKFDNCSLLARKVLRVTTVPVVEFFEQIVKLFCTQYQLNMIIQNVYIGHSSDYHSMPSDILIDPSYVYLWEETPIINHLHLSPYVFYGTTTMLVCRGQQYSPFEKLRLPFDTLTWVFVVASFSIGFIVIFLVNQLPEKVKKFVFGTYITSPTLNMVQIFFGISLSKLPGRNFARYFVMIFSLFCIVIRTAYQGEMFDFLHKNIHKPTVNTIQEMIDQNMTIFYPPLTEFEDSSL